MVETNGVLSDFKVAITTSIYVGNFKLSFCLTRMPLIQKNDDESNIFLYVKPILTNFSTSMHHEKFSFFISRW